MIKPHLTLHLLTLIAALGSTARVAAETAPAAPAPATADEVVTLEKLEVSDVPIEKNILPTSRPFNSVYGSDQNITEIPRNVTIISREQLSAIAIRDVRDFSKLTSSSYTKTNFGAPANPSIRGSYADLYQNGVRERITSNGNGMPIDFNAVESVNIVKGPGTAVQGTSSYVGGFADLITKRPYFDKARGEVTATIGSDDIRRWSLDYGAPINDKFAYRVSYAGEDSEGYYENEYRKTQSVYSALTYKPSDKYELFLNAQFTYMEYTENWGINRPTQTLIDKHLYQTGVNSGAPVAVVPGAVIVAPNAVGPDSQNTATVDGNGFVPGPLVKIDRRKRLLAPGDNSLARNAKLQGIQTFTLDPDTKIVNNNLLTYTNRETFSGYYYSEILDPTISLQSRWEYQKKMDKLDYTGGLDFQYRNVKAYSDYGFEPANAWDITRDLSQINVYNSQAFQNSFIDGVGFIPGIQPPSRFEVPGHKGRYFSTNNFGGDGNESYSYAIAPFLQGDYKLTDKFTLLSGARADFLHVNTKIPLTGPEDSASVVNPSYNLSLVHKTTSKLSTYATYNFSKNTAGAEGNGGGYIPDANPATGVYGSLNKKSLQTPAELFELGAKYSALDGKLFLGGAVYEQKFTRRPPGNSGTEYVIKGLELEANYQPNKNFFATASYGLIDARVSSTFDLITFTGTGETRVAGLPRNQFNTLVSYTFDNGFGASLSGRLHSEMKNDNDGSVIIPWQYELDASVFYTYKNWSYRLAILNLTDEWNFSPPNEFYGKGSILLDPGIRGELSVAYKF
jgi:catecholate siderophore receptor